MDRPADPPARRLGGEGKRTATIAEAGAKQAALGRLRCSAGELVAVAAHGVPGALASRRALADVAAAAGPWPSLRVVLLECRLSASAEQVDVSLGSGRDPDERAFLASWCASPAGPGDARPGWLAAFLARWADQATCLGRAVDRLWLELDVVGPTAGAVPSLFFSLSRPPRSGETPDDAIATIRAVHVALGRGFGPELEGVLRRCLAALPAPAIPLWVGVMRARPTDALRLVLAPFPGSQLLDYLARVGWSGESLRGLETVARLAGRAGRFNLALDVSDVVQPRLGFECTFDRQPPNEPGWGALLDDLVAGGLCSPPKRDALLEWPGTAVESGDRDRLPRRLAETLALFGPQLVLVLPRKISHLKLLLQPDDTLEAKAYLGLRHAFVAPDVLRAARAGASRG